MLKTFIGGLILGIAGVIGVLYAVPVVNQHRETSIIAVRPNGGNSERFHIGVPMDRIVVGAQGNTQPVPPGLEWPDLPLFEGMNAELFKIRNERDAVVGLAARVAADDSEGNFIEWVLHLPARGSAYVTMSAEPLEGGYRVGAMRHGTREYATLTGTMTERWVPLASANADSSQGRIELDVEFVGTFEELDEE